MKYKAVNELTGVIVGEWDSLEEAQAFMNTPVEFDMGPIFETQNDTIVLYPDQMFIHIWTQIEN